MTDTITLPGWLYGEVRELLEARMGKFAHDAALQGSAPDEAPWPEAKYPVLRPVAEEQDEAKDLWQGCRDGWMELARIRSRIIHGDESAAIYAAWLHAVDAARQEDDRQRAERLADATV